MSSRNPSSLILLFPASNIFYESSRINLPIPFGCGTADLRNLAITVHVIPNFISYDADISRRNFGVECQHLTNNGGPIITRSDGLGGLGDYALLMNPAMRSGT